MHMCVCTHVKRTFEIKASLPKKKKKKLSNWKEEIRPESNHFPHGAISADPSEMIGVRLENRPGVIFKRSRPKSVRLIRYKK